MRTSGITSILIVAISIILISDQGCSKNLTRTDTETLLPPLMQSDDHPKIEVVFIDTSGKVINYSNPSLYLVPGTQSAFDSKYVEELNRQISISNNDLETIRAIFNWKQNYFKVYSGGGNLIGKVTVNQVIESKSLSGCHDHGLVLASIFRNYGFPALMVDAAGIQWAFDYADRRVQSFSGHVFVEVYVNKKWILINSTNGEYIENYDPTNPVITLTNSVESRGYYALLKGSDPEGYGINSNEQLIEYLKAFSKKVKDIEMSFATYQIKRLN